MRDRPCSHDNPPDVNLRIGAEVHQQTYGFQQVTNPISLRFSITHASDLNFFDKANALSMICKLFLRVEKVLKSLACRRGSFAIE